MASEVGVLEIATSRRMVQEKGRLQPGKMFLVDTSTRVAIVEDDEIKCGPLADAEPYERTG